MLITSINIIVAMILIILSLALSLVGALIARYPFDVAAGCRTNGVVRTRITSGRNLTASGVVTDVRLPADAISLVYL